MTLQIIWFLLVGVLLTVYAVLDGFDLGVGVLQRVLGRTDAERRAMIASVGPLWDGNEVWLLTGGGALFAAFPPVYATVFSGFYLAMILVVLGLIVRAISIEFRNTVNDPKWRNAWDWGVAVGSLLPALLLGVAVGNLVAGVPLDAQGNFAGTFFTLLTPYTLAVGVLGLVMFLLHGALYLNARLDAALAARARQAAWALWIIFVALFVVVTAATWLAYPRFGNFASFAPAWLIPVLCAAAIVYTGLTLRAGERVTPLLASGGSVVALMGILGLSLFPNLVLAGNDVARSLTVYNASSSPLTLQIMLILVIIGLPIVLVYTTFIYRVFWRPEPAAAMAKGPRKAARPAPMPSKARTKGKASKRR